MGGATSASIGDVVPYAGRRLPWARPPPRPKGPPGRILEADGNNDDELPPGSCKHVPAADRRCTGSRRLVCKASRERAPT